MQEWINDNGAKRDSDYHHDGMYGMPLTELYDLQEPGQAPEPPGVEQILPPAHLPEAYAASRSEIGAQ